MDQMDIDHIVDVPDTPDRLTRPGINGKNGVENENRSPSAPCYSRQQNIFEEGSKYQPMIIDSGSRGLSVRPSKTTSTSNNTRCPINSTGSSFSCSSSSRNAHLFRKGVTDANPSYLSHDSIHNHLPRSVRPSCISKSYRCDGSFVDLTERSVHRPVIGNVGGVGSSGESREEVEFNGNNIQEKPCNGFLPLNSVASPGVNKQKRLVRNGCISPNNIAKAKQSTIKEDNNGSLAVALNSNSNNNNNNNGSKPSSAPSVSFNIRELVAEESDSYARKGKGVITHPCSSKEPASRNKNLQSSDYNKCAGKGIQDSGEWRSTRNRNREMNTSSTDEELQVISGRPSSRYSSQHHKNRSGRSENGAGAATGDDKGLISSERPYPQPFRESVSHPRTRLGRLDGTRSTTNTIIKRQKQGAASSAYGQCSTSVGHDPDFVSLCSPAEAVNSAFTTCNLNNSEQIIEVDELSPQLRRDAGDEDVKSRQVEADELLARELQEQFYNEAPVFGSGEVDEYMALALQHQDDSNHGFPRAGHLNARLVKASDNLLIYISADDGSAIPILCISELVEILSANALRWYQIEAMSRSMSSFRRQSQSRSSSSAPRRGSLARSSTSGRMTRLRSRFPGQARTLFSSREGTSLFPEDMDIDMRMHILGALEEFNDMGSNGILQFPRDFTENDYEMLLSLDDNNDRHSGASVRQINDLPQSVIQSVNFEETCAVCLETPSIGETIRHLPCLHKFHKDFCVLIHG
ncbi:hypothetical protein OROGR_025475 [Orobanche gracilis]